MSDPRSLLLGLTSLNATTVRSNASEHVSSLGYIKISDAKAKQNSFSFTAPLRGHSVADCRLNTSLSPGRFVCVCVGWQTGEDIGCHWDFWSRYYAWYYYTTHHSGLQRTLCMPPEEFIRGCDHRCCDSALNHGRPRRLLIQPQRDTATYGPVKFGCGIRPRAGCN